MDDATGLVRHDARGTGTAAGQSPSASPGAPDGPGPAPAPRGPKGLLLLTVLGLVAAILVIAGLAVWNARARAIAEATRELRTLSVALGEQTTRALQAVNLALDVVQERARAEGAVASAEALAAWAAQQRTHDVMANAVSAVPQADVLLVIDSQGHLLASSRFFPPPSRNLSDREYFERLRTGAPEPVIGVPVLNRGTDTWAFHVARRIAGPDGTFLGATVAAIELDWLAGVYASLGLGRDAGITLIRADGTLLVRHPQVAGAVGRHFGSTPQVQRVLSAPDGEVARLRSAIDGQDRLLVTRSLPGFPLRLNVSFGVDAVLQEWRDLAWQYALAALLLLGLTGVTVAAARRAGLAELRVARATRRAEAAAVEHAARLRHLVEQLPVAVAMLDQQMRYVAVSERFIHEHPGAAQLGAAAYAGRSHYDCVAGQDDRLRGVHQRVLAGETAGAEADPVLQPDGRMGWMRWHMAPWHDGEGQIGGATLFIEMVTDRIEADRALRSSEARLRETEGTMRLAMEAGQIGSYRKDQRLGLFQVTPGTRRLQGLPEGDRPITLAEWRSRILPEDTATMDAMLAMVEGRREPSARYEYRLRDPEDGRIRTIEARAAYEFDAEGRLVASVGVIIDVTEKIAAAAAQRESEERLRLALEATEEGLWDWRVAEGRVLFSDRWQQMLGHAPGMLGTDIDVRRRLMHPDDRERAETALRAHIAGRTASYACELRMRHRDGRWIWMLDRAKVVERDAAGAALRVVGTQHDIADRKAVEEALAAREAELSAVLESVPECVKVIAADGRLFSMNRAGLRMIGASGLGEVAGAPLVGLLCEQDRAPWTALHDRVCAGESGTMEYQALALDGRELTMESLSVPVSLPGLGRAHLSISRDVTALREAERELRALQVNAMKASRVSAVGAMAAGLAHELNQPLSAVANFSAAARIMLERLAGTLPDAAGARLDEVGGILRNASDQAVRAGQIVRRLRDYIRGADIDLVATGAAGIVEDALEAARLTLPPGSTVALSAVVAPNAGQVYADALRLQQVFANLVRNATEALHGMEGGRVVIGAERAEDGTGVVFSVSDNGPGLSAEARRRVFEAFNTTKPLGLGVGLAICRAIVDGHGGRMWVDESGPLGGACFRFAIPDMTAIILAGAA